MVTVSSPAHRGLIIQTTALAIGFDTALNSVTADAATGPYTGML
jgi:hypothetical protein